MKNKTYEKPLPKLRIKALKMPIGLNDFVDSLSFFFGNQIFQKKLWLTYFF